MKKIISTSKEQNLKIFTKWRMGLVILSILFLSQLSKSQIPFLERYAWQWNDIYGNPFTAATSENSGEDWTYSIKQRINRTLNVQEGYIMAGYGGYSLQSYTDMTQAAAIFNEGITSYYNPINFTVPFVDGTCDIREGHGLSSFYEGDRNTSGDLPYIGMIQLLDMEGGMPASATWAGTQTQLTSTPDQLALTVGEIDEVIQSQNKYFYYVVGYHIGQKSLVYRLNGLHSNDVHPYLGYNPNLTEANINTFNNVFTDQSNIWSKNAGHCYVAKIRASTGEVVWEYLYGSDDFNTDSGVTAISNQSGGEGVGSDIIQSSDINNELYVSTNYYDYANDMNYSLALQIDTNGYLLNKQVLGTEYSYGRGVCQIGAGKYAFISTTSTNLWLLDNNLNILPNNPIVVTPTGGEVWDLEYMPSSDIILVPCVEPSSSGANYESIGNIYGIRASNGTQAFVANIGSTTQPIFALDERIKVTPTNDGGFAAVTSVKSLAQVSPPYQNELGVQSSCNFYPPNSDPWLWDTDALVEKYDINGNEQWQSTFDADPSYPSTLSGVSGRIAYPSGDLRHSECMFAITQGDDGGILTGGKESHNAEDFYVNHFDAECSTISIPSNIIACVNQTIPQLNFSGTPAGGSFSWIVSDPTIGVSLAANGTTGNIPSFITANVTATATATVTVIYNGGCTSNITGVFTITVSPTTTVTASASSLAVCLGNSVTLSGSGATNYIWTGGEPYIYDNLPFYPTSTATYTVTDMSGCSNTSTITITVNPLPIVIANSSAAAVCNGNGVTLTGGGATSYVWDNGVSDGIQIVPVSTTTYNVTGTDGNGCSNTSSLTIMVNECCANSSGNIILGTSGITMNGQTADNLDDVSEIMTNINGSLPSGFATQASAIEISHQTFYINGTFYVDQDLTIDASELIFYHGQLVVTNGATLTITNSYLHGCGDVWEGIAMYSPNERVVLDGNLIEDALNGLSSYYGGKYVVENNIFNKNVNGLNVSIYSNDMSTCQVEGNVFTCRDFTGIWSNGVMTNPYADLWTGTLTPTSILPSTSNQTAALVNTAYGTRSVAGILVSKINYISPLLIGGQNTGNYNLFDYLQYGVKMDKSNVSVQNNVFENITDACKNIGHIGTAVYTTCDAADNNTVTVGSIAASTMNRFDECCFGIYTKNYNSIVTNNAFTTMFFSGVNLEEGGNKNWDITGNNFNTFRIGVYCYNINRVRSATIKSNNFNTTGVGSIVTQDAIRVDNAMVGSTNNHLIILYNTIHKSNNGINCHRVQDFKIINNTVLFNDPITYPIYGIRTMNCNNVFIKDNGITKTGGNPPGNTISPIGISVQDCPGVSVINNNLIKIGTGIWGQGNLLAGIFQCNNMQDNSIGINFGNGIQSSAQISDQLVINNVTTSTGNDWGTGTTTPNACIYGNAMSQNQTSVNWYYYNPSNPLWLTQHSFFTGLNILSNPVNLSACIDINGTHATRSPIEMRELKLGKIVRGESKYAIDSTEYLLRDSIYAFNELSVYDTLINLSGTDDTLYKNYYEYCKKGNLGKFTKVNTYILDSISADTVAAEIINNNIISKNKPEDNQKAVNEIYIKKIAYEQDSSNTENLHYQYNNSELTTLENTAYQNPFTGGEAVYEARVLLLMDMEDGDHAPRTMLHNNQPNDEVKNYKLYPNPNTGTMTLEYNINTTDTGILQIYDVTGKQLKNYVLNPENKSMNIIANELSAGVYYYSIKVNDLSVKTDKLVIIR